MQLHEEFKEYEEMWDDLEKSDLKEDFWINARGWTHFYGTQILGILASLIGGVVGFALAPLCGFATIALWIKSISLVVGVLSVLGLFISEDLTDEAALEQSLAKADIMQLAKTNPKLRKKIQHLYDLVGPEKASKLISRLEAEIQKQAKPLAKTLKDIDIKDLEANEELISKKVLDQAAQKVVARATTEED